MRRARRPCRPASSPRRRRPIPPSPTAPRSSSAPPGSFGACGAGSPLHLCGDGGPTALSAAAGNQTAGFGARFIRFGPVQLGCTRPLPDGYWDDKAYLLLTGAYYSNPRLIPIVDFTAPPTSQCTLSSRDWHDELQNFVVKMQFYHDPQDRPIPSTYPALYVEVGNEPNLNASQYPNYPNIFAAGAAGLYANLNPTKANITFPFYRILTGGMIGPTADRACSNVSNVQMAEGAIDAAKSEANPYGMVNPVDLGVAVHPYGYRGTQNDVWRNSHQLRPRLSELV